MNQQRQEIDPYELINVSANKDLKPKFENFDSQAQALQIKTSLIKNKAVEGECQIDNIELIQLQTNMLYLSYILSFITIGLFALLFRFSLSFKKKFLYIEAAIENATHCWIINSDRKCEIITIQKEYFEDSQTASIQQRLFIVNRYMKYIYFSGKKRFEAQELQLEGLTQKQIIQQFKEGNSQQQAEKLIKEYGICQIQIPKKKFSTYFFEVLTEPFFLLQYFAVIIWVLEGFLSFPIVMISVSILITIINYILMSIAVDKLKKIAEIIQEVKVLRDTSKSPFSVISSTKLVPGDLFIIEENMQLPCDTILISGELLLNEASLTGEVTPIPKFAISATDQSEFNYIKDKRYLLCEGTKVLQTKKTDRQWVIGLVARTGYCSFKGQIFRAVLFPKPNFFQFYTQGIKFSIFLIVAALIIYFILLYKMIDVGFSNYIIILRFADTITWMIPPALPIFFSICTSFALARLRGIGIIGVDPDKILVAGKVKTMCFDKTGTLTTTGIDIYGYQKNVELDFKLGELIEFPSDSIKGSDILFRLFATCHGAYLIGEEIVGDALDVTMLQFSGWKIENSEKKNIKFTSSFTNGQQKLSLQVLKTYEFESELQRMSCIVFDPITSKHIIFVKGSPEKISELCIQSSIPQNFQTRLQNLAIKGLRIIGLSYRDLDKNELDQGIDQLEREKIEQNLRFLGFLILQNKLKDDTKKVIKRLREADIDCKVISGDNPLTTLQTARECSLINNKQTIVVDAEINNVEGVGESHLRLKLIESDIAPFRSHINSSYIAPQSNQIDSNQSNVILKRPDNMEMNPPQQIELMIQQTQIQINFEEKNNDKIIQILKDISQITNTQYELTLSGNALDYFIKQLDLKKSDTFQQKKMDNKVQDSVNNDIQLSQSQKLLQIVFNQLLLKTKVFARMRPEQKSLIIEYIQKQNHKVGMIGDGANDCAAIKQADVGISFAAADSAFSAPFSSSSLSIDCVENVLLEGRATICNNIEVYRYDVCANVYKYAAVCVLLFNANNLSEFQYLFINYFTLIPALFFLAFSRPIKELSCKLPNDDLMDKQNFFSMLGQIFIVTIGFVLCYNSLLAQNWFIPNKIVNDTEIYAKGPAVGVIFLAINVFYMFSIIAFFISKPFKQKIFYNYGLTFWIIISLIFGTIIIFVPKYQFFELELNDLEGHDGFLPIVFVIIYLISAVMVIYEDLVVKNLFSKKI